MKQWLEKIIDENPTVLYYAAGALLLVTPVILRAVYYYVWVMK